ncbi:hypothetical protein SNE40_009628 [Patella caerulea]|uniref:Uncharacterized protein n=1 Tax=Patella caerulea TaxID=87958 RepID=A0AAN8JVU3_PATCE
MILCVMAVLLVTFTVGNGAPQWRPQGRFGKRIDPTLSLLLHRGIEKTYNPSEEDYLLQVKPFLPEIMGEISIEGLGTDAREHLSKLLHRLCSESGLDNVPRCSW